MSQDPETIFAHINNNPNIGDYVCSPGHYYDLGKSDFAYLLKPVRKAKRYIIGGGHIFSQAIHLAAQAALYEIPSVIWGIGYLNTAGYNAIPQKTKDILEIIPHLSIRDYAPELPWDFVPCASCKSELFDRKYSVVNEVVYFKHMNKGADLSSEFDIPTVTNFHLSFQEAISFIASGDTVITSSYHGTYWAMLLGKKVICLPFNKKFNRFKHQPTLAKKEDISELLKTGNYIDFSQENILEDYRKLNDQFYEKVRNTTWDDVLRKINLD